MIRQQEGFSLVELMITMVVFVMAIAAASRIFTGLLTQFKQQSKISETNIEGAVGLEMMRRDLAQAGYGLPWNMDGAAYNEAVNDGSTVQNDALFNDSGGNNPPRALVSGNALGDNVGPGGDIDDTDVLVVKSVSVAANAAARKWTNLFVNNEVTEWTPTRERLNHNDRVIVILPQAVPEDRILISGDNGAGVSFTTRYNNVAGLDSVDESALGEFSPPDNTESRVVYGIAGPAPALLRMPFNRADYYVRTPGANFPARCATGTGILYKATVNHANGNLTQLPLLDCVADMQVVYGLDNDEDGDFVPTVAPDAFTNDISGLTAEQVRNRVRQVRVYVLAHEGQRDTTYTFTNFTGACATCVRAGETAALGRDLDLATSGITNYLNYRWKVYTLVVRTAL